MDELLKEWDFNKNLKDNFYEVNKDKQVFWLCKNNHSYKRSINERIKGASCPICNGGRHTSFNEQAIYFYLKKLHKDTLNKYQGFFKNLMEVDIYIPHLKVAIEYDGYYWHQLDRLVLSEQRKYQILKEKKIKLIRITEKANLNQDKYCDYYIETGLRTTKKALNKIIQNLVNLLDPLVYKGLAKESKIKVDIEKDELLIASYNQVKKHSLQDSYPEVASEWCYEKNQGLTPYQVCAWSELKVFWQCQKGHIWEARIDKRVEGTGCPYCDLYNRKYHNPRAREVYQYNRDGLFLKKWPTARLAAEALKIDQSNIASCCNHKRKTAGNFRWEYDLINFK